MSFNIREFFKQPFTARTPEREVLVVPVHERINQERWQGEVQAVLAKAAEQVAGSGLIWRWIRHEGSARLVRWDAEQLVFLQGNLSDWISFFATHWRTFDTDNREYRGPSPIVTDRLIARILEHPSTPAADWALQLQRKREATK